ncbi:SDR family NAD(P)-dependent oxidoreductase [Amycolatopsis taiwanensis]|uniref:Short-chain dehydrogenase/reductase n=1 Tax=Amycolatopsis taiwanensis TaxID=342230 RepID=A0A9W6VF31_9PSEU|nr:SDR family NAD(P)-dependent oxidoreductase [Amycolatopsis taiwanensis]GLY69128.1 short-chain dehydrogenase/reductase [Amycolatopsis taiwanensis]
MRIWLVTGASRGLGSALVGAVLARGDAVVATARVPEQIAAAAPGYEERLLRCRLDVTDPDTVRASVAAAIERFGRIDVLVNNAGRGLFGAVEETSVGEAKTLFETNVFGVLSVTNAVLPVMRAQRSGHVLMMSSMGGFASGAGFGVYAASKFAVEGLAEALREELAQLGITVTIVEPGVFETEFASVSSAQAGRCIDDYHQASDTLADQVDDEPAGDPAWAASQIVAVTARANPPLRVPLGSDAVARIRGKLTTVAAELADLAGTATSA